MPLLYPKGGRKKSRFVNPPVDQEQSPDGSSGTGSMKRQSSIKNTMNISNPDTGDNPWKKMGDKFDIKP